MLVLACFSSPMNLFLLYIPFKKQGEACKDKFYAGKRRKTFSWINQRRVQLRSE